MKKIALCFVFFFMIVVWNSTSSWAISYSIIDLGKFHSYDINNQSSVVGYSCNGDGISQATIWNASDSITYLTNNSSTARAINENGKIVIEDYSENKIFLWENNSLFELSGFTYNANDINNNGQIVGCNDQGAILWKDNNITSLGTLGGSFSNATAINDFGHVVGFSETGDFSRHAFVWDSINGMMDIGTLGLNQPGIGSSDTSLAFDINNKGQVVGYAGFAFLWENNQMVNLGSLYFHDHSYVYGINEVGQIVGNSFTGGIGDDVAFLWEDGSMHDLNVLVTNNPFDILQMAYSINDFGQIVGSGMINGETHSFLLTPEPSSPVPEPSTILLMGLGLAGLIGIRARKKRS
jgi:probable HAF family extracellular repeat protein